MLRRCFLAAVSMILMMFGFALAGASGDVRIYKGETCGYYGGQKVFIINDGDRVVKATVEETWTHGWTVSKNFKSVQVEPGETKHLGCDTFGQGNASTGHVVYVIKKAYYPLEDMLVSALDDVKIEKAEACGYYGGQNVYITNNGDQVVKATIEEIQTHDWTVTRNFMSVQVEPGESKFLGCDTFGQGNASTGHVVYIIKKAYYVR